MNFFDFDLYRIGLSSSPLWLDYHTFIDTDYESVNGVDSLSKCESPNLVLLRTSKLDVLHDSRLVKFLGKASSYVEKHYSDLESLIVDRDTGVLDDNAAVPVFVPCGKCLACRKNKAGEFAVRCYLESLTTNFDRCNQFVTFTYDDDNVTDKIDYDHINRTFKEIRKYIQERINRYDLEPYTWLDDSRAQKVGSGFRYMVVGELGDRTKRPHFHALLFGLPADFAEMVSPFGHRGGHNLFRSHVLESYWNRGNVIVGDANFGSAFYTAGYALKKAFDIDQSRPHFSTNPGLGYQWYYENLLPEILARARRGDFTLPSIQLPKGKVSPIPHYFLRKLRLTNPLIYDKIKVETYYNSFFNWSGLLDDPNYNGIDYSNIANKYNNLCTLPRDLI